MSPDCLFSVPAIAAMTLSYARHVGKSKTELLDEITRLEKELRLKNDEISTLKKKILLYKSI
jgi:hypothetical protein